MKEKNGMRKSIGISGKLNLSGEKEIICEKEREKREIYLYNTYINSGHIYPKITNLQQSELWRGGPGSVL